MHPSSRRVGPTSARNSASSKDSCPSRAFNKTMSVTASFGSLPALDEFPLREALLLSRRPLLPARRPPTDLFARFAIKPGLYRNTTETPAPNTIATRNSHTERFCGVRDPLFGWRGNHRNKTQLLLLQLPPRIQTIEIQNRIQHQRIRPPRLPAINRIDREQNHVSVTRGHIRNRRVLRDLFATVHQSRNQQLLVVRITQNHARPVRRRDDARIVHLLLLGHLRTF